jgi:hypothetical protein
VLERDQDYARRSTRLSLQFAIVRKWLIWLLWASRAMCPKLSRAQLTNRMCSMTRTVFTRPSLCMSLCGFILIAALGYAQEVARPSGVERTGLPWDWSHEHVVFSATTDPSIQAVLEQDPRWLHQQLRKGRSSVQASLGTARKPSSLFAVVQAGLGASLTTKVYAAQPHQQAPRPPSAIRFLPFVLIVTGLFFYATARYGRRRWLVPLLATPAGLFFLVITNCGGAPSSPSSVELQTMTGDWSANIGAASAITHANANNAPPMYPAKYSFNVMQNPSCANDYVVFATGAKGTNSGGNATPSIVAFNNLYSSQGGGLPVGDCGTTGPSVVWAYLNVLCSTSITQSQDQILSSPVMSLDGKKVAWVTSDGIVQILTIGTAGSNGSVSSAECVENAPGGTATSPNNAVLNSVILGNAKHNPTSGVTLSQIFVDYNSDSAYVGDDDGFLHKITPFFGATATLTEQTSPSWQALHAYSVGTLIVDSNGFIQKCTTAGISATGGLGWNTTWGGITLDGTAVWTNQGSGGGWPLYITGVSTHTDNTKLAGPVFDGVSKNIFIGDANGSLFFALDPGLSTAVGSCANDQSLYPCVGTRGTASSITTGGGAQMDCSTASPHPTCLVMSNHQGFTEPVVVDSTNGILITQFSNADGTNSKVEQTNTSLSVFNSANLTAHQQNLSNHIGAFDNAYYSTPSSGYYYVCAPDSTGSLTDLYRVSFTNTAGTVALGSTNGTPFAIATSHANCSGPTEIYNTATSTDWLFLSVDNQGITATCGGQSCVMSFALGSSMVSAVNASYAGSNNLQGTGGMIVDNIANTTAFPQASSIYFTPIANNLNCGDGSTNTVCGIKLTQSGLQ